MTQSAHALRDLVQGALRQARLNQTGGNAEGVVLMTLSSVFTMKRVVLGCFCAGAVAAAGCAGGASATSPSATTGVPGLALSASFPRSGELRVVKECSQYGGLSGQFCTITSSNLEAIEVGSRVTYAADLAFPLLDSDIVLDSPRPGNNKAFGHCRLDLTTGAGLCTFTGGTGKFTHFSASAVVSALGGPDWAWDGTYSFSPQE